MFVSLRHTSVHIMIEEWSIVDILFLFLFLTAGKNMFTKNYKLAQKYSYM